MGDTDILLFPLHRGKERSCRKGRGCDAAQVTDRLEPLDNGYEIWFTFIGTVSWDESSRTSGLWTTDSPSSAHPAYGSRSFVTVFGWILQWDVSDMRFSAAHLGQLSGVSEAVPLVVSRSITPTGLPIGVHRI